MDADAPRPVLLYDGHCGLCHGAVRLILRLERRPTLFFAPQQSQAGRRLLDGHALPPDPGTVVLVEGRRISLRSDAVLRALRHMGGLWPLLALAGGLIPRPVRNWAYDVIARNRYRWFKPQPDACELPSHEAQKRFL